MSETPQAEDSMVAALLRERAGYAGRKGKEDRVEAVDEQLRLRGYNPDGTRIEEDAPAVPEPETPADPARTQPPKGRRAQRPEQA